MQREASERAMEKAMTKFYAEDISKVYKTVRDARIRVKGQVLVRIERPSSKEVTSEVRNHWIKVPESGKQGELSREDAWCQAGQVWKLESWPSMRKLHSPSSRSQTPS